MESTKAPKAVRQLVVLSAVFLAASLIISGVNAYVALASPPESQSLGVPLRVGFEGQLSDSAGNPVNGSRNLTFSLYDEATGTAAALWVEEQTVTVTNGLYSVQLGSVEPLQESDFQGDRWLGILVDGDANELSPRIPINSVPFALNAKLSENSISTERLQGNPVLNATPMVGQSLTWSGADWRPITVGSRTPSIILRNSAAETVIFSKVIPANSLSTNGNFQFEVWALVTQGTNLEKGWTYRIKFGSKTIEKTFQINRFGSDATRNTIHLNVFVANAGSASSQCITTVLDYSLSHNAAVYDTISPYLAWDTASVDTGIDQTIEVTFQMEVAHSTYMTQILGSTFNGPFLNQ